MDSSSISFAAISTDTNSTSSTASIAFSDATSTASATATSNAKEVSNWLIGTHNWWHLIEIILAILALCVLIYILILCKGTKRKSIGDVKQSLVMHVAKGQVVDKMA